MFNRLHTYTVHTKPDAEPILVREGFSVWAFIFGGLWLLAHRCWIPGVLVILLSAMCRWLEKGAATPQDPIMFAQLVLMLFIGFEAREMYRESLGRRGYELTDIVKEVGADQALMRYYERHQAA